MVGAWLLTLPAAATIGALTYLLADLLPGAVGTVLVGIVAVALSAMLFARRARGGMTATG
jgi:PiT family inorganic phosphate transporter